MNQAADSQEVANLRSALDEALETLRAIRAGEVDALVMADAAPGARIYGLSSVDRPYRLFVETMRDGAATVSADGIILYANHRLAEMLGYATSQLVASSIDDFVAEHDREALARQDGQSPDADGIEIELRHRSGEAVPTRVGGATLEVDGEHMMCLTFADLTAVRRHEAVLAHAHEQALEALRLRSLFVANMSHEIRTPLNGVTGMTHLMLGTELTEEQFEYAHGVRTSAAALMSVVDQILDFSKLDNGHLQLDYAEYSAVTVLEEACAVVSAAAADKGIELLSAVEGDVPEGVLGDPARLRQVLTNLMTNAVKFTDAGHVATMLSARKERGRWRLRFRVCDTGVGVRAEATEHIFDSFSQADSSTTRQYGGTGLGLAISRQLVELMGGEIGVESTEGEGSCFWFTLLTDAVATARQPKAPPATLTGRVLLVDDNHLSCRLLSERLQKWGLTCQTADSGKGALDLFWGSSTPTPSFDVALVDCDMPGMSGIELVSVLKALPERVGVGQLTVVMMMTSQRNRETAREAGVEWFVSKPVREGRLFETLASALTARRPAVTAPAALTEPRAAEAASVARRETGSPDKPPTPSALVGSGRRVLLAEDNHINQMVGSRMLQKRGLEVDVAANGEVAVEMHARQPYAAIFMDCNMPVLDGYQATKEIRHSEHDDEHVPIIAMTANFVKGDREKCLAAGMDDYLSKPFTGEALDLAVDKALGADSQHSPSATALLDPEALEDLCLGDEEIRQDLVTMFIDQSQLSLAEIAAALDTEDPKALVARAHNLKGSSVSLGALRMAELSDQLCVTGRAGVLDGAPGLLAALRHTARLTWDAMGDRSRALRASA